MNAVEKVLSRDMIELLERLAASVPGGSLTAISATQPTLRRRLDEMEDRLTTTRAALLDGYGQWRRALEDVESLWALGVYKCDALGRASAAEEPVEPARSIAARGRRGEIGLAVAA